MGRINYPSEFAMRTATLPTAFIVGNLIYLYRSLLLRVHRAIPSVVAGIAILSLGWQFQSPSAIILHTAFVAGSIVWFCIAGPTVRIKLQGDFSYGIYVYHLPILTVVLLLTGHRSLHIAGPLTFALSLTLAALSWFSIERKFLALKNLRVLNELGEITQDKRASFPPKSVLDDAITEPNIKVLKID
jgi:peptidoglycan/LPS O-acetylase OafA/YrhL